MSISDYNALSGQLKAFSSGINKYNALMMELKLTGTVFSTEEAHLLSEIKSQVEKADQNIKAYEPAADEAIKYSRVVAIFEASTELLNKAVRELSELVEIRKNR